MLHEEVIYANLLMPLSNQTLSGLINLQLNRFSEKTFFPSIFLRNLLLKASDIQFTSI